VEEQTIQAEPRRRGRVMTGIVAGVVAGSIAAVFGLVSSFSAAGAQESPDVAPALQAMGRRGHHRMGAHGMGIHGEFVTPAPGGGYQTLATQRGEVTSVSASSLTVKSEDGFSRTYVIDDNTMVNAGNDGIADVKTGDEVHVMALVKDGKASAVDVRDATRARALGERWHEGRPEPAASPATSTSSLSL
jgi:hypothetical protein